MGQLRPLVSAVAAVNLILSLGMSSVQAEHIEEVLIHGEQESRKIDLADTVTMVPDSAALVKAAPGANVNANGPLTGIPQYRGMYGSRVNVTVNGTAISSGGPNWMDPPLSYAPAAQLESLTVYRGIAPVSVGQETIGGAIDAKTWSGKFTDTEAFESTGYIRTGLQSVNESNLVNAAWVVANQSHKVKVLGLNEQGDSAEFEAGDILHTEYERQRVDFGYAYKQGAHNWEVNAVRSETGDSGTPALPMDIVYIDSDLFNVSYRFNDGGVAVESKLYYSDIAHGMTNYHMRTPGMMQRKNIAIGESLGAALKGEVGGSDNHWAAGIDWHNEIHDSNISDPSNEMFFAENFKDAERNVVGVFVENARKLSEHWRSDFGLRVNQVSMDSDTVTNSMANMGMGMAVMLRDRFNNADLSQTDTNFDWLAKLYYEGHGNTTYYAGVARKSRAPSYQERYLWMAMEATAGLADGNTYLGNPELDSEVAHEIELGFDYVSSALMVSPRIFYRDVTDFIQGTPEGVPVMMSMSSGMDSSMASNMDSGMEGSMDSGMDVNSGMDMPMASMSSPVSDLMFNNVDAEFYGFDVDWNYQLSEQLSLKGIVNYVRGKRTDISDDLYRIAPLNGSVAVNYQSDSWGITTEGVFYAKQDNVSDTNYETKTAGYGLLNINGYWQVNEPLRVSVALNNLLDKNYRDHLSGYNRVSDNSSVIAVGDRLPGYGQNLSLRVDYTW